MKLPSLTDYLTKLELVDAKSLSGWWPKSNPILIENQLGNVILYPQKIPISKQELDFYYAMFSEAVFLDQDKFLNRNLRKLFIPEFFLTIYTDLSRLVRAFVDALKPDNLTAIILKSSRLGNVSLGSYISLKAKNQVEGLVINIDGVDKSLELGSVQIIPSLGRKVDITVKLKSDGAEQTLFSSEVSGGKLGLVVDLR